MSALILRNRFQGNTTLVENEFIDNYMAAANGEYVKVYLLLLRHLNNPCIPEYRPHGRLSREYRR